MTAISLSESLVRQSTSRVFVRSSRGLLVSLLKATTLPRWKVLPSASSRLPLPVRKTSGVCEDVSKGVERMSPPKKTSSVDGSTSEDARIGSTGLAEVLLTCWCGSQTEAISRVTFPRSRSSW